MHWNKASIKIAYRKAPIYTWCISLMHKCATYKNSESNNWKWLFPCKHSLPVVLLAVVALACLQDLKHHFCSLFSFSIDSNTYHLEGQLLRLLHLTNLRVLQQILNPCRLAGFRILPLLLYFWFSFYPGLRLIYIIADSSHTSCCGCSEEVVSRLNAHFKYAAQTPGLFSSFWLSLNGTKIKKNNLGNH